MYHYLLEQLQQIENECNSNQKFYCRSEYDSNTTKFEQLGNDRKIAVKTNLDKPDAEFLMNIFQMIYDKNWVFDDEDLIRDILNGDFCNCECNCDDVSVCDHDPDCDVSKCKCELDFTYNGESIFKYRSNLGTNTVVLDENPPRARVYTIKDILKLL